jgi:hypothetical protein
MPMDVATTSNATERHRIGSGEASTANANVNDADSCIIVEERNNNNMIIDNVKAEASTSQEAASTSQEAASTSQQANAIRRVDEWVEDVNRQNFPDEQGSPSILNNVAKAPKTVPVSVVIPFSSTPPAHPAPPTAPSPLAPPTAPAPPTALSRPPRLSSVASFDDYSESEASSVATSNADQQQQDQQQREPQEEQQEPSENNTAILPVVNGNPLDNFIDFIDNLENVLDNTDTFMYTHAKNRFSNDAILDFNESLRNLKINKLIEETNKSINEVRVQIDNLFDVINSQRRKFRYILSTQRRRIRFSCFSDIFTLLFNFKNTLQTINKKLYVEKYYIYSLLVTNKFDHELSSRLNSIINTLDYNTYYMYKSDNYILEIKKLEQLSLQFNGDEENVRFVNICVLELIQDCLDYDITRIYRFH